MLPRLEEMVLNDKDLYLRKIDIDTWKTKVAKQYNVFSIPNIRVFDRGGKQRGEPTSSLNKTLELIRQAKGG